MDKTMKKDIRGMWYEEQDHSWSMQTNEEIKKSHESLKKIRKQEYCEMRHPIIFHVLCALGAYGCYFSDYPVTGLILLISGCIVPCVWGYFYSQK